MTIPDILKMAEPAALADAAARFPDEACGLVVGGEYVPCDNCARDCETDFAIDPRDYLAAGDELQAVFHSHNNYPHLSALDMRAQSATAVPWGMANLVDGVPAGPVAWWGDQLPLGGRDLLERPFVHGCWDCYGLVRDWYRAFRPERPLPDVARDFGWWNRGADYLVAGVRDAGLSLVPEGEDPAVGDVVLFKIRCETVNHCAVFIGGGMLLHHLFNRLSRREPAGPWLRRAVGVYRP
jgi:proteasome lid subunit RPN8/RPN11